MWWLRRAEERKTNEPVELDWEVTTDRVRDNAWDAPITDPLLAFIVASANPIDSPLDADVARRRIAELPELVDRYDGTPESLTAAIELARDIHSKLRDEYQPWVTLAECALWGAKGADAEYDPAMVARVEFLARKANRLRPGNPETEAVAAEYRLYVGYAQEAWNRSAGIETWRGRAVAGEAAAALGRWDECRDRFLGAIELASEARALLLNLRLAELALKFEDEEESAARVAEVLAVRSDHPWACRLAQAAEPVSPGAS